MARLLVDDQTFERELARWGQGKIENFKGRGKGNREIPEVLSGGARVRLKTSKVEVRVIGRFLQY